MALKQLILELHVIPCLGVLTINPSVQIPVLVAVDDYNVLYSHANYHEWMNEVHRRQVQPHELRLASALRGLEQEVHYLELM